MLRITRGEGFILVLGLILCLYLLHSILIHEPSKREKVVVTAKNIQCRQIQSLGYKIDGDACDNFYQNSKYKVGQVLKMINSNYAPDCKFTVTNLIWAHGQVINVPYYGGNVICYDKQGNVVLKDQVRGLPESELEE